MHICGISDYRFIQNKYLRIQAAGVKSFSGGYFLLRNVLLMLYSFRHWKKKSRLWKQISNIILQMKGYKEKNPVWSLVNIIMNCSKFWKIYRFFFFYSKINSEQCFYKFEIFFIILGLTVVKYCETGWFDKENIDI